MTKTTQPAWGYGLNLYASAKEVETTVRKSTKAELREQFQKRLFLAMDNENYDVLPSMVSDPMFVGVDRSQFHQRLFRKYNPKLFDAFKPCFDGTLFQQQIYMYAEREQADEPLLQYFFDQALSFGDETTKQDFLISVATEYLADPRPLAQQVKHKALKSGGEVFDHCVGQHAQHYALSNIFEHVIQYAREEEWKEADILMSGLEQASWDKLFLHALEIDSYFFMEFARDPHHLTLVAQVFDRYPFLHDFYHEALLVAEKERKTTQEVMDAYLPSGTPFDETPFWDVFVQHKSRWKKGDVNELFLRQVAMKRLNIDTEGSETLRERMIRVTEFARAQRQPPFRAGHYLDYGKLDDFVASDLVPRTPPLRRRCFTEVLLGDTPSFFLKLPYHNMPDIVQKACQHDDVLLKVIEQSSLEDFKTLVELDGGLKTRSIGGVSVANLWARAHYASSKSVAQQMIRLHPGWFEDGTLWDIFVKNGLNQEQQHVLEKTMMKKTLRQDDGDAGRKTRSRAKKTRKM